MKTKTAKQPKRAKPAAVQLKDLKPKKQASGGARQHSGGMNVALGDGSVRLVAPF